MTDQLTRRQLLERAAIGGTAITLPGLLAACGSSGTKAAGGTTNSSHQLAKTLHFSNWTLYIDVNNKTKSHPSLDTFKKKTGVNVDYVEDINSYDEFFGKMQPLLTKGDSGGRSLMVANDPLARRMYELGYLQRLDKEALGPAFEHLNPIASQGSDAAHDY